MEFGYELAVLLQGRVDRKNVNPGDQGSRYHFSPFGFFARHAGGTGTILLQIFFPVTFFQQLLDFVRSEERTIAGVFDSIEVNIERHDGPFEPPILADVKVVAHNGTTLVT